MNHPNIIHIYDISEAEGMPFLAMEYVVGKTPGDGPPPATVVAMPAGVPHGSQRLISKRRQTYVPERDFVGCSTRRFIHRRSLTPGRDGVPFSYIL